MPQHLSDTFARIGQGVATYGVAAHSQAEQAMAGSLRSRQRRPRRIAVVGATGGVGTTCVAALLASVVSAVRDDQTLLFSLHSDASDVAIRLAVSNAPCVTDVAAGLHRHGRILPSPVTSTGLRVLSGPPPGQSCLGSGLDSLLDAAAGGHGIVVVDAGVAGRTGNLAILADLFDTVILVGAMTPDALVATEGVLVRWRTETASGAARLIRLAVRIRSGTARARRDLEQRPLAPDGPAHVLAHDPELARGRPIELRSISGRSMTTILSLGAEIMSRR